MSSPGLELAGYISELVRSMFERGSLHPKSGSRLRFVISCFSVD